MYSDFAVGEVLRWRVWVKVYHGLDRVEPPTPGGVLIIGNFDGVHRAHAHLIATARSLIATVGGAVTVLTFEPHPLAVVAPGREPARLSTPEAKLELLERAGADVVVVARSEPALLGLEPEAFVRDIIRPTFRPTHIVEGPSFGFGKGRRGNAELLERLAGEFGCRVHVVDPVTLRCDHGEPLLVSSSLIRRLIAEGDVERAALCLDRPYRLTGTVVHGDRRGREIGFPTANVESDRQLVPGEGVYAGSADVGGRVHAAAISIGCAPTFFGQTVRVEAHLLAFDGDLYDQRLALNFERRLRGQKKFSSSEALIEQLKCDVEAVRNPPPSVVASTRAVDRGEARPENGEQ